MLDTGMDFGAVTTATCIAAALASAIMGLYGRYPIAQAPGMGENFFFVLGHAAGRRAMIAAQVAGGQIAAGSTTPGRSAWAWSSTPACCSCCFRCSACARS